MNYSSFREKQIVLIIRQRWMSSFIDKKRKRNQCIGKKFSYVFRDQRDFERELSLINVSLFFSVNITGMVFRKKFALSYTSLSVSDYDATNQQISLLAGISLWSSKRMKNTRRTHWARPMTNNTEWNSTKERRWGTSMYRKYSCNESGRNHQ